MEIKIDTSKDSKEDIKKMIYFLQRFVEHGNLEPSAPSGSMFNMFDDDSLKPNQPEQASPMSMFDNDSATKTTSDSAQDLINDSVNVRFEKDDDELDEVQKLKEKSTSKSEDLRIISYK